MRIVSWNIRAGGGRRAEEVAAALASWAPDIAVLAEFRGTPASGAILARLADCGLTYAVSLTDARKPAANGLALASRLPFRRYHARGRPGETGRWLAVEVTGAQPLLLAAVHIPNEVTRRKWPYMEAVMGVARAWRSRTAIIAGDTNSGRPVVDEENPVFGPRYAAWFDGLEALGWRDAFRHVRGARREYTWYSPNGGNGFRIDQAFVSRRLVDRVRDVEHVWAVAGGEGAVRRDALSDHAALIIDLEA
jgi:exonuclease III